MCAVSERSDDHGLTSADGTKHAGPTPLHWQRVGLIVTRMTGKRVGIDTATRMANGDERQDDACRRLVPVDKCLGNS